MKPRRSPMTNAHALLDGTETAFRQVHASELLFAIHFEKVNISWVGGQLLRSSASTYRKEAFSVVTQELHGKVPKLTATLSTRRSFDKILFTMVKKTKKRFEK